MATAEIEIRATNRALEWARASLGLDWSQVGEAVGANRRTVHRWRKGEHAPSPEHREGIEELRELKYLLESVFPEEDDQREWLFSSVPMLRGRTPISLIRRGQLGKVIAVLAGLESGAFA